MMNQLKERFLSYIKSNNFFCFIGVIILSYYIWFRFIRERLPKDLPFHLSLLTLIILVIICILYLYTMLNLITMYYNIWQSKTTSSITPKSFSEFKIFIIYLISKIYVPLILLDTELKKNTKVKHYYYLILKQLTKYWHIYTKFFYNSKNYSYFNSFKTFFVMFIIMPKVRKDIHYHVDDATAMSSSHELAQRNPILKKAWKKGPIDNSFQHPVIGRDKCEIPSCKDKICNTPCGQITQRVYVGYVTHSNQYGIFVSYNDFNNKSDTQYFVAYIPPVPNMDISGDNINKDRTDNLNTKNTEARTMIHLYTKENSDHDS